MTSTTAAMVVVVVALVVRVVRLTEAPVVVVIGLVVLVDSGEASSSWPPAEQAATNIVPIASARVIGFLIADRR